MAIMTSEPLLNSESSEITRLSKPAADVPEQSIEKVNRLQEKDIKSNISNQNRTKRWAHDRLPLKPILDQVTLTKALRSANIHLKENQLESFYQQLHRQNYPSLSDFVKNYSENANSKKSDTSNSDHSTIKTKQRTQKNALQLPKAFLNFLLESDKPKTEIHVETNPVMNDDEYSPLYQIPQFATLTSYVSHHATSADGTTTKLAVTLQGNSLIHNEKQNGKGVNDKDFTVETVIMRHGGSRITLCVSSQVGCAMGCTFCATGTMGILGNLSSGEILEQIVHAENFLRQEAFEKQQKEKHDQRNDHETTKDITFLNDFQGIRNVVFMGMGEPLNNYKNVVAACKGLMDRRRWNLAHHRITVSTVGVTSKMRQLTQDLPEVNLALSLHAPNQRMRTKIVPTASRYPIEGLIDALDGHMASRVNKPTSQKKSQKRKAMIEYVMLTGPTSTFEAAHELGKLCENRNVVVNLIPYNQTDVKDVLTCPSESHMKQFQDIVTSYKVFCFIRRTMGADIAGACGQLVVEKTRQQTIQNNENLNNVEDIEDFVTGSSDKKTRKHKEKKVTSMKQKSSVGSNIEKKKKVVVVVEDEHHKEDGETSIQRSIRRRKTSSNMEKWIPPLMTATAVATVSFIVSSTMLVTQKYRGR